MPTTDWAKRTQLATKPAPKHGETWTSAELEIVTAFEDETAEELARALGRTLFAIQSIRQAVREGKVPAQNRSSRGERPYSGWTEGQVWWD